MTLLFVYQVNFLRYVIFLPLMIALSCSFNTYVVFASYKLF